MENDLDIGALADYIAQHIPVKAIIADAIRSFVGDRRSGNEDVFVAEQRPVSPQRVRSPFAAARPKSPVKQVAQAPLPSVPVLPQVPAQRAPSPGRIPVPSVPVLPQVPAQRVPSPGRIPVMPQVPAQRVPSPGRIPVMPQVPSRKTPSPARAALPQVPVAPLERPPTLPTFGKQIPPLPTGGIAPKTPSPLRTQAPSFAPSAFQPAAPFGVPPVPTQTAGVTKEQFVAKYTSGGRTIPQLKQLLSSKGIAAKSNLRKGELLALIYDDVDLRQQMMSG